MTYKTRNIFVAVALAVMAALLTSLYVSNYKRNVRNAEESVTVWVAKRDIPANTPGADLAKKGMLSEREVARRSSVPGAISDPAEVSNQLVLQPIYAGEQVSARRFGNKTQLGVRAQLKGNLRAVVVPGTPEQLLAGTLRQGDRVDLVNDARIPGSQDHFSRIVVRDLLVLKAPEVNTASKLTDQNGGASVMLAIRDFQSQRLQWAVAQSRDNEWTLTLRAPVQATDGANKLETGTTMIHDGVTQAELNRAGFER